MQYSRVMVALTALIAYANVNAQTTAPAFLSKAEVESLATDKKWVHKRMADGNDVVWDLRSGGNFYANNRTQNGSDSGTWLVNDKGELCVKWRRNSVDRCVGLVRDGNKFKMFDSKDSDHPYADLTIE